MGNTTNYGLPYPEATDLVIQGDDAIQALAETWDDLAAGAFARSDPNAYIDQGPVTAGPGVTLNWVALGGSGHFSGNTVVTYTGRSRVFLIAVSVGIGVASGDLESTTRLYTGGGSTILARSTEHHNTANGNRATHTMVTIVQLNNGSTLHVDASVSAGGVAYVENAQLSVASLTLSNV